MVWLGRDCLITWHGLVGLGEAGSGVVRSGLVWQGRDGLIDMARQGLVRCGGVWSGGAWQGLDGFVTWRGAVWYGAARLGAVGLGQARLGPAW